MTKTTGLVLLVLIVTLTSIFFVGVFHIPVAYAGVMSAVGIGVATAIVKSWPSA